MKLILSLFIIFINEVLSHKISPGCGVDKKPPVFGIHDNTKNFIETIHVTYDDKLLGPVKRNYIIQIPNGFDNNSPVPMVLDLHGWTGSAQSQTHESGWKQLGKDKNFIVVWPDGMADSPSSMGSWNCSMSTGGPLGPTCDLDRAGWETPTECYYSCPLCDELTSCDWTTCYDDIGFVDYVINHAADYWCIDMNQIHLSGISNGGMFAWYAAAMATDGLGLATINPIGSSSLIGFGTPPDGVEINFSIVDFHGTVDDTIPYNESTSFGIGPHDTLISSDGFYYEKKATLLSNWAEKMNCDQEEQNYYTPYDGEDQFQCYIRLCARNNAILRCFGVYGHDFPLAHRKGAAAEIAYEFMKNHPRH